MARRASRSLTHVDSKGKARMVDVTSKKPTSREATAEAFVVMSEETLSAVRKNEVEKGDVVGVARLAGIMAAKRTHELIPLCHPLALTSIDVEVEVESKGLRVRSTVRTTDRTGVEMEALTAASIAALTIYDMCKALDRSIAIERVRLLAKSGGRSGTWKAR